jgi:hypothetical protein
MFYATASVDVSASTDPQLTKGGLIVRVFLPDPPPGPAASAAEKPESKEALK